MPLMDSFPKMPLLLLQPAKNVSLDGLMIMEFLQMITLIYNLFVLVSQLIVQINVSLISTGIPQLTQEDYVLLIIQHA